MSDETPPNASEAERAASLADVRVEIDAVDDNIHTLLMRRAELVQQVVATKRLPDGSLPKGAYRPAREASIIRRLHGRNRGPLPFGMVFSFWRQMIGAFTAMQTPVTVSVQAQAGQDDRSDLIGLTREHFGAGAAITGRESFGRVARDMEQDKSTIGVASARFEGEREGAWWTACMSQNESTPHVIAALPFYGAEIAGYCLSRAPLEASESDETLLAVQFDTMMSRSGIASALSKAKIDGTPLHTTQDMALIRVAGFHAAANAPMHRDVADALNVMASRIAVVGAYPTPIRETKK
jgi:chorismate mutase